MLLLGYCSAHLEFVEMRIEQLKIIMLHILVKPTLENVSN